MKKYLLLLPVLFDMYGNLCDTQLTRTINQRRTEIQNIVDYWRSRTQSNDRSSGHAWSLLNMAYDKLDQFNANPYSQINTSRFNNTHTISSGSNRNETSCADICIIKSGIGINLNCPVAHSCSIENGINSHINCPLANNCSVAQGVINSSITCR